MYKQPAKEAELEIRNFKVTSVTSPQGTNAPSKRIEYTCEGKGRLVDWNWIEGFSFAPRENVLWPSEWVVVIQRGGKEIKRRMKLTERSKAITRAINEQVALYVASNGLADRGPQSGPLKTKKDWPANSKRKMARSGPKSGPQGQSKPVAPSVALSNMHTMDIQPGPQKDSLDLPEFLRR